MRGTSSTRSRTASASSRTSRTEDLPDGPAQARQGGPQGEGREAARKQREEIQAKILKLNKEREQYPGRRAKEAARSTKEDTLDKAIVKAIRDQAARHNFKFE